MRGLVACGALTALIAISPAATAQPAGPAIAPWPQCLAGRYDGSGGELAARLQIEDSGRFAYRMSYGALDEGADGSWSGEGGVLRLTSDPVNPPRYALASSEPIAASELRLALDLPRGISAQFFEALIGLADGSRLLRPMNDEGIVVPLEPGQRVANVTILLTVFELESEAFAIEDAGQGGRAVRVRFDPNDLGTVAFDRTALKREGSDLLIERRGRTIRFRTEGRGCLGR